MDVQSNITLNDKGEFKYTTINSRITKEIILTTFFIVVICVDVAIVYTIFCFKRLHTVPYILYANRTIADLLCAMVAPSGYEVLAVIMRGSLSHEFLCIIEKFGATFHLTVNLFVIFGLFEWFTAAYFGRASENFCDSYVVVTRGIWIFAIVYAGISLGICFQYFSNFLVHYIILLLSYGVAALLVIGLQISRIVKKIRHSCTPTLNLTFGTIYVMCALLLVIQIIFGVMYNVLLVVTLFGTNLVNFGVLMATNIEFRKCFLLAIKCKRDTDNLTFKISSGI